MSTAQKQGFYLEYRPKDNLVLPPSTLGYAKLDRPDEAFGKSTFNLNAHFTQGAAERLADVLERILVTPGFPDLQARAEGKTFKIKHAATWVEDHLQAPSDAHRIQEPFLKIVCNSHYKTKSGEPKAALVRAWDAKNNLLDLPSLRITWGSIIQVVVSPALYVSQLSMVPKVKKSDPTAYYADITLRLLGLRILKLERYEGGGAAVGLGNVSDEDMALVQDGFNPDDLSSYRAGSKPVQETHAKEEAGEPEVDPSEEAF